MKLTHGLTMLKRLEHRPPNRVSELLLFAVASRSLSPLQFDRVNEILLNSVATLLGSEGHEPPQEGFQRDRAFGKRRRALHQFS
jgi:hypothetical protein